MILHRSLRARLIRFFRVNRSDNLTFTQCRRITKNDSMRNRINNDVVDGTEKRPTAGTLRQRSQLNSSALAPAQIWHVEVPAAVCLRLERNYQIDCCSDARPGALHTWRE
jgi:hypothetical protein